MRILTVILILISMETHVNGQVFPRKDATYVYEGGGFWASGITKMFFEKDTLVDHKVLMKFSKEGTWDGYFGAEAIHDTQEVKLDPIYFYTIGGVVQYSLDLEHFDTLYNFDGAIGDSWSMAWHNDLASPPSLRVAIRDTMTSLQYSTPLKCQRLEYVFDNDAIVIDTVCQLIGGRHLYVLPWDLREIDHDGGEGGPLRCYSDGLLGVLSFPEMYVPFLYDYECDVLLEVFSEKEQIPLVIYPNPVRDEFRVSIGDSRVVNLSIIDFMGRSIMELPDWDVNQYIDVSGLGRGLYVVCIVNKVGQESKLIIR